MIQMYAIIDDNTNICENTILWDGESNWSPGTGKTARIIENCGIGNEVEEVNGVWQIKQQE